MDWHSLKIWELLAGLGLFLFGMFMMEESIKSLSGRAFKLFLSRYTHNPVLAVIIGALTTMVLQSSSMVSLLVMSFVGAGVIGLRNGIGIIMGANLGTTVTGWIVSLVGFKLDIAAMVMPILAVGGLSKIFLKSERAAQLSKLVMAFGFVFLGLGYMKEGFIEFAKQVDFTFLEDKPFILFVGLGLLLSASIQSSSATMMITLSSLSAGVISLHHSFYIVIGSDIGTTVTALIGTLNANAVRKKVGWSHVFFNCFNACVVVFLVGWYEWFIIRVLGVSDPLIAVVVFHSLLNLTGIVLLLPFINRFTAFLDRRIATKEDRQAKHLMHADPTEAHAAIQALERECMEFVQQTLAANKMLFGKQSGEFNQAYFKLKNYEGEVVRFYMKTQQQELVPEEAQRLNHLSACIRNAILSSKDLKDVKHNLDQLAASASDRWFGLHQTIAQAQLAFYQEIQAFLMLPAAEHQSEFERIKDVQKQHYKDEARNLYGLYAGDGGQEVDISTLQNLLREVSNSNESLLRALKNLMLKDKHADAA